MSPGVLSQLLPIALLVLLLYVMVIRPARKRAQKVSRLQSALSAGDEVMLTSGIYGTVLAVDDDRVSVTVADGVVLSVHRGAIGEIVRDIPADAPSYDSDGVEDAPSYDADGVPAEDDDPQDPSTRDTTRGAN